LQAAHEAVQTQLLLSLETANNSLEAANASLEVANASLEAANISRQQAEVLPWLQLGLLVDWDWEWLFKVKGFLFRA
jgi:hypothetical protein